MGIIPTRVGTRVFVNICIKNAKDHPHACGDKTGLTDKNGKKIGSSPRVWGQVTAMLFRHLPMRIIPTRVGTSCVTSFKGFFSRDHPHACGDKSDRIKKASFRLGSSPRVWGQASTLGIATAPTRIIPTRVGTSFSDVRH